MLASILTALCLLVLMFLSAMLGITLGQLHDEWTDRKIARKYGKK